MCQTLLEINVNKKAGRPPKMIIRSFRIKLRTVDRIRSIAKFNDWSQWHVLEVAIDYLWKNECIDNLKQHDV